MTGAFGSVLFRLIKAKETGRFASGSFRLPSVRLRLESIRLRLICQFACDSYVKALKLNSSKVLVEQP